MPVRATRRGAERTALDADCDVLICGASFAGLAVARELAGSGANVVLVDRYEVGERQTSACAAPTAWLQALDLASSIRQSFEELVIHSPSATIRYRLPWTLSTFDYRELCALLAEQGDARFETATVQGLERGSAAPGELGGQAPPVHRVRTDRGELRAPLVVDALGWRRVLDAGPAIQPPRARLSRGLEVHPRGRSQDLEIWIDPRYVRAGYSWSFPAAQEIRVGAGSFEPRDHVREPTVRLATDLRLDPVGYQGNWIPHQLRPAVAGGIFFVGDSAGHCLPLSAEGIRPALYFGLACGRELRAVLEGRSHRETALERYGAFSADHRWHFEWLLRLQHAVGRLGRRPLMTGLLRAMNHERFVTWAFENYLNIAHPSFADAGPVRFPARNPVALAA
ncbi:MAG TPA: NAD(P)/FAD-dependent oxidoreductase [Solirubrobacteraceae bacterium]|jgi:flavin-dependent dehydrogenase|nr:NAD(P)/FAD-dependent oxidoreductase [Solirubrobacteraceae bacterium]